jgi:hypothetical protein
MAAQPTVLRISKSILGAALFVVGMFILYENLVATISQMSHILANGSASLGVLPAAVLAVSQAVHGLDPHQFLQCLFRQILLSSWPLLLVICGTVLSSDQFADSANVQERTTDPVCLASERSTYK